MPMTDTPPRLYTKEDIPRPQDMEEYLSWVRALRDTLPVLPGTPRVPPDMDRLTYEEANDIERILFQVSRTIGSMTDSWVYAGEFTAGGI